MAVDPVREEAERLVAAAIAAVSTAARGFGVAGGFGGRTSGFATGSPECCVCPVCRVIAAMRDPGSDLADRLAAGAGDLAAGVTSMLRAFARAAPEAGPSWAGERPADTDPWHAATTGEPPPPKPTATKTTAKKAVAKKSVAKKAVKKAAPPTPSSEGA